ncbi:DsbA family protein [Marivita sp. XM-24bin2]|jgi:protein-disulfide isomerase|uniref:DsbA family protein n=1 Tax=unclassified Marivita TaxID=2632480 RepID=UPI000D78C9BC|nr:DsbA family protein [Marivita sp. XM-24bin2]PWL36043.1 MAG: disulfide bond formation protein DsbA [Marivita sp. XM-24bin2]
MRKNRLATSIAALLMATGVQAADLDLSNMSEEDRAAFGAQVRAYLLENPEVIMEAVQVLEERQAAQQAQGDVALIENNAEAIFNDGYSWVGGNPEGDVTIVEFFDYRCGFCRRAHPEVAQLLELDGNIRYVAKEFPILGENSLISSRFALAAREIGGDDAYEAAKEALIVLNGDMDETVLRRLANTLGLDADAVLGAMDDEGITEQLATTRALAQTLQINGTPSFVMGDQLVRGYVPLDAMQQIVAEARQD